MALGSPLGVLTPPLRGGQSAAKTTSQYAVAQVRIDKEKEKSRLVAAEQLARDWQFVRGGSDDEEPRPNLTGLLNFLFEQVESEQHVRDLMEMRVQKVAMDQMEVMIEDMSNSEDDEEVDWAANDGAEWMIRAQEHLAGLSKGVTASMKDIYVTPYAVSKTK